MSLPDPSAYAGRSASPPRATVRLQLHAGYTLRDACRQVDYYARLGASHLYLSPITQARPGSAHGYDVCDHGRVSDDLGGEAALLELADAAHARGLGLIADIVPNHMAAHVDNPWWRAVLEEGRASAYAGHFDIDWDAPDPALAGKVLLPVLGEPYGEALEAGAIRLRRVDGRYAVETAGQLLPLAARSLDQDAAADDVLRRHDPARADGRRALHAVLERQHYRLAWWRTAADQINWRRFFEISELAGVRVEDPAVFRDVHALVLRLYAQSVLDGVRVDHVDGLASPQQYLDRLRRALAAAGAARPAGCGQPYIVVEKILAPGETLDPRWEADGTTGYDFLDQVGALLHDPAALPVLEACWRALGGDARPASLQLEDARRRMLERHFVAERLALARALAAAAGQDTRTRDWTAPAIGRVLEAVLTAFPVYRSYAENGGRSPADLACCRQAWRRAAQLLALRPGMADARLLGALDEWLDGRGAPDEAAARARAAALRRFQQLTPPLAAKALEDTLFYRYGPLLSRNEVGAAPGRFALEPGEFAALCRERGRRHPRAMLATATHDHKRGEDARARLAVLSERPAQWAAQARAWVGALAHGPAPAATDVYMLLQTLVGAWPAGWTAAHPRERPGETAAWLKRIAQWQVKALREAKLRTSWTDPDAGYEKAAADLVQSLLGANLPVLEEVAGYAAELEPAGFINGLAQTLLRNTLPGVPDLYQGAELWDFSMVDPDNRRPVDYGLRARLLDAALARPHPDTSPAAWTSGAVKQALIQRLLTARRRVPGLYAHGDCERLETAGPRAAHVYACARRSAHGTAIVIAPRLCAWALRGYARGDAAGARAFWAGTRVRLGAAASRTALYDAIQGTGLAGSAGAAELALDEVLADWPVALLLAIPPAA